MSVKRYHAVIFHPGPKTAWRTGRKIRFGTDWRHAPVLVGEYDPDPAEVILQRSFRNLFFATVWARSWLKRLKNVCAEIYDAAP